MAGFSDDYEVARRRFLAAVEAAGARLTACVHPSLRTPGGAELAVDLAWLGPLDAKRVLLATSGMHGFEGPAGSAVQSAWLETSGRDLPDGIAVLLVHALNPWGFAWVSRLTENNVDLNRNFVDWSQAVPINPYYSHVRDTIRIADLSPQTLARLMGEQIKLAKDLGPAAARIAVDFGQYEDVQGISFGGDGREFGHQVMQDHVVPMLAKAQQIGLIDWHTGVGAYGEVAVLPIDGPDSENAKRLEGWWGRALVQDWKRSDLEDDIEKDPNFANLPQIKTGQMNQALARWLPDAQITGAVVEFGSEKEGALPDLILVTLYERWLRFVHKGDRMASEHQVFRDTARRCFVPEEASWRDLVLTEGPKLLNQAVTGLAQAD